MVLSMRRWQLNSGYNGTTDQRRTKAGTIPMLKHNMERNLGVFFSSNDSFFDNVSLLMKFEGADTSTTFTDAGPLSVPVTAVGTAQISTARSKFGSSSLLTATGGSNYANINTNMTAFAYPGDFTIEGWWWFNVNNIGYQPLICAASTADATAWALVLETNNTFAFYGTAGSGWSIAYTTSQVPTTGAWHHVAVTRSGSSVRMFYNGTQIGTTKTSAISVASGTSVRIGGYQFFPGGARSLGGNIDELRITKGVARYTANFTPPSSEFL